MARRELVEAAGWRIDEVSDDDQGLRCHWYEEPDGSRWMIPGCIARAWNPDGDCTCSTSDEELAHAVAERDQALRKAQLAAEWSSALLAAVVELADSSAIVQRAQAIQTARRADSKTARLS